MQFDEAFERLIGHEGVFSSDPKDVGNWTGGKQGSGALKGTKYGISAAQYPGLDIRNLTLEQAKAIYLRDYWTPYRVEALPPAVRFDYFDGLVNSGPGGRNKDGAVRWLQRAVGVDDDGRIGPVTLAAVAATNPTVLCSRFNGHRLLFLTRTRTWAAHGAGWARRVAANMIAAA